MKRGELEDPYIIGEIPDKLVTCDICLVRTTGIDVENVTLPEGIEPSTKLIVCLQVKPRTPHEALFDWPVQIGIGCGCYARIHRQIAHIQSRQKQ